MATVRSDPWSFPTQCFRFQRVVYKDLSSSPSDIVVVWLASGIYVKNRTNEFKNGKTLWKAISDTDFLDKQIQTILSATFRVCARLLFTMVFSHATSQTQRLHEMRCTRPNVRRAATTAMFGERLTIAVDLQKHGKLNLPRCRTTPRGTGPALTLRSWRLGP